MRLDHLETLGPKFATICGAAAGAAGTVLSALGEVAMQVLGVQLSVVVAAAAGAGLARSFKEPEGFFKALFFTGIWTVLGCVGAPLAQAAIPAVAKVAGMELILPANALAGAAALVASSPWWAPKVWPWVQARLPGGSKSLPPGGANG